jgi:hypothetical protein
VHGKANRIAGSICASVSVPIGLRFVEGLRSEGEASTTLTSVTV